MRNTKKRKIVYTDEPIGPFKVVKNFLPKPENLILKKEAMEKVTISLPKSMVVILKKEAVDHNTEYQKMIRVVIERYVMNTIRRRIVAAEKKRAKTSTPRTKVTVSTHHSK